MLRPSELGITGVKRTIKQHKSILTNSLVRMLNIRSRHAVLAQVCLMILNAKNGEKLNIKDYKLTISERNEIVNYFGEAMGPIWCQELIPGIKTHDWTVIENNSKHYDFKVYRGQEVFLISNKTRGKYTNTLKPDAIVRAIRDNEDLYRIWGNEDVFGVFEVLDDSSVIQGPIKAIARYYPNAVRVSQNDFWNVIRQLTKNDVVLNDVPESIMKLISEDSTASVLYETTEQVTGTMINFLFEKILVQKSQDDPLYNKLYVDANQGNIKILKFNFDLAGNISYNLEEPNESGGVAVLRSKQGIDRRDNNGKLKLDKLGLTV